MPFFISRVWRNKVENNRQFFAIGSSGFHLIFLLKKSCLIRSANLIYIGSVLLLPTTATTACLFCRSTFYDNCMQRKIYSARITTKGRYGHAFENLLHTRPIHPEVKLLLDMQGISRKFIEIPSLVLDSKFV